MLGNARPLTIPLCSAMERTMWFVLEPRREMKQLCIREAADVDSSARSLPNRFLDISKLRENSTYDLLKFYRLFGGEAVMRL